MLFNNPKKVQYAIYGFVAVFILGLALHKCHAAEVIDAPYVQVSGGAAVVRGPTQVLDLTFTEKAPQLEGAFWEESLTIVGTSTYQGQNVSNNMLLRGLFMDGFGNTDVGLGVCWMLNPGPYNGSNMNFNLQLDHRYTFLPITLTYTHCSNAGMRLPNLGRDLVMVGWRF